MPPEPTGIPILTITELIEGAKACHLVVATLRENIHIYAQCPSAHRAAMKAVEELADVIRHLSFVYVMGVEGLEEDPF